MSHVPGQGPGGPQTAGTRSTANGLSPHLQGAAPPARRLCIGVDASRAFRAEATGTERYSQEILRHLLVLPQAAGADWRLYADRPPPARLADWVAGLPDWVHVRVLPARRLWTHRTLAREVLRDPPDVLFVPARVIPWVLPPTRLPPCVVTVHDVGYRYFPQAHPWRQRLYLELSTRWNVRVARRVIAVSRATAQDLVRFYRVPPEAIAVIHEGVTRVSPPDAATVAEVQARYGLVRPYGLYVGTIQPRKNLARLIQAYARLVHGPGVGWDLVLAGRRGWLSDALYAAAGEWGVADRVHFTGYVAEPDRVALLRGARFFAFPSLFEGFGLPVLEAQQMGVPVMCANNSALPEVAGDAAILVDAEDVEAMAQAMLRLSQDEALRERLIAAGYENVKRFSWRKAAEETLAVLEAAARSRRSRSAG